MYTTSTQFTQQSLVGYHVEHNAWSCMRCMPSMVTVSTILVIMCVSIWNSDFSTTDYHRLLTDAQTDRCAFVPSNGRRNFSSSHGRFS